MITRREFEALNGHVAQLRKDVSTIKELEARIIVLESNETDLRIPAVNGEGDIIGSPFFAFRDDCHKLSFKDAIVMIIEYLGLEWKPEVVTKSRDALVKKRAVAKKEQK